MARSLPDAALSAAVRTRRSSRRSTRTSAGCSRRLDELGLRENTIVVFQSDNGHSTEERAFFGGGSAGPYRGAKFSLFEGGIRLPAIISWPGHLPEGQIRAQLAHGCDWMPTLAELAGVKLVNPDIDGKSLAEVIASADAPTPARGGSLAGGRGRRSAVGRPPRRVETHRQRPRHERQDRGLPLSEADKKLFLSDLADDPGETREPRRRPPRGRRSTSRAARRVASARPVDEVAA